MKFTLLILAVIILVEARKKNKPVRPSKGNALQEPNDNSNGYNESELDVPNKELVVPDTNSPIALQHEHSKGNTDKMSFSLNIKDFSVNLNVPANFLDLFFGGGHRGPPQHQGGYGGPDEGGYGGPDQGGVGILCWDWTLGCSPASPSPCAVTVGDIMTYNNDTYTCTENDWLKNGPDTSQDTAGCWSPIIHRVLPYGTDGYYCCDHVYCADSNPTWVMTGDLLPNCNDDNFLCWNWMTREAVPVGSTLYFECNQYLCMEGDDWVQNGERDPTCETAGCFSVITQEIVPHGVQGYWKCDSVECMPNNEWQQTGGRLPGCGDSK